MREMGKKILVIVLVLATAYSFALSAWTFKAVSELRSEPAVFTGRVQSGQITMCINNPPSINTSACNATVLEDTPYSCRMNASDADSGNQNFSFSVLPLTVNKTYNSSSSDLPFTVTGDGNISFTPTNWDVGYYEIEYTLSDDSGCSNGNVMTTNNLTVINVNDAPYLTSNLPAISLFEGETVFAFFLSSHFTDDEGDALTYVSSGNSDIVITIASNSQVIIRADTCDVQEAVIFTAIDPYNATGDSNTVTITCTSPNSGNSEGGSGSGSGGGGGGSVPLCKAEFECYQYHMCNISNQKLMNCIDKNGCENEEFVTVPCEYKAPVFCNETWSCTDWGQCLPNSTQYRVCGDQNSCGTNATKPLEAQKCEYIGTCTDGIKNCHDGSCEEGIDCGGTCNTCKSVEVPYPFEEEKGIGVYVITGVILLLLMSLLVYHYFRKEINSVFAKVSWYLTKKSRKQYLLSKEDQKKLMAELADAEKKLSKADRKEDIFNVINSYSESLRYYLSKVLDFGQEFDQEQLKEQLEKKKAKVIPILRKIFASMFDDYTAVSTDAGLVQSYKAKMLIEELRNMVLQTSPVSQGEYPREVQEIKPKEQDNFRDRMTIKLTNAYVTLQFVEIETAKKKYLEVIADYEKMSEKEQELTYQDIIRLYSNITYMNAWAWRYGQ